MSQSDMHETCLTALCPSGGTQSARIILPGSANCKPKRITMLGCSGWNRQAGVEISHHSIKKWDWLPQKVCGPW